MRSYSWIVDVSSSTKVRTAAHWWWRLKAEGPVACHGVKCHAVSCRAPSILKRRPEAYFSYLNSRDEDGEPNSSTSAPGALSEACPSPGCCLHDLPLSCVIPEDCLQDKACGTSECLEGYLPGE